MSTARPRSTPARRARTAPARPRIDLALQGGGSHGAYTWGVLDALLEDGRLEFDGVSGTSAGAMNAAVLATGYARGGRDGARVALRDFWAAVSGVPACFGPPPPPPPGPGAVQAAAVAAAVAGAATRPAEPFGSPWASLFAAPSAVAWPSWMFNPNQWPMYAFWDGLSRAFSPYQLNPFNFNPLRDILARHVDLALLAEGPLRVFVTATAVTTGRPRIFHGHELTVEALLASACIPQMFQAVTIDGEAYWDGGFSGNPALWPLIYETSAVDLVLVQINPLTRAGVPTTAIEIADRLNEITFNASLMAEMRAIAFVKRLLREQRIDADRYKDLRLHRIDDEDGLAPFDASSKLNADPRLLQTLFDLGRRSAHNWLEHHHADIGVRSSVDIEETFLSRSPQPVAPGTGKGRMQG
ncbi:MAG: patatin-like phospholipase family protein [Burkholderiales bacterium]